MDLEVRGWIDMKLYIAGRGKGKTQSLIYTSMYTGYPIICYSQIRKDNILSMAKTLGVDIKVPYTLQEYKNSRGRHEDVILIDDLNDMLPTILNEYFNNNVCGATMRID